MFYRMRLTDPLDTEIGRDVEGIFSADEIEVIRDRYYSYDFTTRVIEAELICGDCHDCRFGDICNR